MKRFLLITFIAIISLASISIIYDEDPRIRQIKNSLEQLHSMLPRQKVFLHLDRQNYNTGEIIWYKAYLTDAARLLPDTISTNLYVELISPHGHILHTRLLKIENGMAHGDTHLSDTLPSGKYRIRAYTNWMRNFGEQQFFTTEIKITNTENPDIPFYFNSIERRQRRRQLRNENDINVQFLPEGGTLIAGIENRIALKAVNHMGESVEVSGRLLNRRQIVATFSTTHNGMGIFNLRPESDAKYKIEVDLPEGKTQKFDFPEVKETGIVMNVNHLADNFRVVAKTNRPVSGDIHSASVILTAQVRNIIYYAEKQVLNSDSIVFTVPKQQFPGGIVHFTLFDGEVRPRCERLIFNMPENQVKTTVDAPMSQLAKRQKIPLNIRLSDAQNQAVAANFSLSVTDANFTGENTQSTISSYFLLASDLRGQIENPAYYFEDHFTSQKQKNLDLVMLTHGWRQFKWQNILNDVFPEIKYEVKDKIEITGKTVRDLFDIPMKGSTITLTILNQYNDFFVDTTGANGRFEFTGLDYRDTVEVMIEALSWKGNTQFMVLSADEEDYPQATYFEAYTDNFENLDKKMKARKTYGEASENRMHGTSNNTIYVDDRMTNRYSNVLQLLEGQVPGLQSNPTGVRMRGSHRPPLFLIDGTPVDEFTVRALSPNDVERIEVLKGSDAAIYGSRGGSGVIAIYTKHGFHIKRGLLEFDVLGFYTAREFYSPVYETGSSDEENINDFRKTIYWNPNLQTGENGEISVEFYNSDKATELNIVIQGVTSEGQPFFWTNSK